jgi:hypothetical protein
LIELAAKEFLFQLVRLPSVKFLYILDSIRYQQIISYKLAKKKGLIHRGFRIIFKGIKIFLFIHILFWEY